MRKLISFMLTLLLLMSLGGIALAGGVDAISTLPEQVQHTQVLDEAGVLEPALVQALLSEAERISQTYACEVSLALVDSANGKNIQAYADDLYDYSGYGYGSEDSGILFVIAVAERRFAITTYGTAIRSFTDYGQTYMDGKTLPYLKESDWSGAAKAYFSVCEELLAYEREHGAPYDRATNETRGIGMTDILLCLAAGFILALIPVSVMKKQMHNVQAQSNASDYVCPGSFELSRERDHLVNTYVTRVPRPKESTANSSSGGGSTLHSSSSGRSHGGHSGSF